MAVVTEVKTVMAVGFSNNDCHGCSNNSNYSLDCTDRSDDFLAVVTGVMTAITVVTRVMTVMAKVIAVMTVIAVLT